MTLKWVGQAEITTVGLIRNNLYRARWVVANPIPLVGCAALPTGPIIQSILSMPGTGTAFPADLQVFTTLSGLPTDWPADRRDVAGRAANECVVWAQMRAASDIPQFPIGAINDALAPFGGRLIDFWDDTLGIPLIENQSTGVPPTTVPPGYAPPPPTTQPPTTTPPPPPTAKPPTTTKQKAPPAVVIPWAIILIGGASLIIRALK